MEAEAEKEIEANFPSYFDEVQQQFFSGELTKRDYTKDMHTGKYRRTDVDIETVFAEILDVSKPTERSYLIDYLKDRLEMVRLCLQADRFAELKRTYGLDTLLSINSLEINEPLWQEDTAFLIRKTLSGQEGKPK